MTTAVDLKNNQEVWKLILELCQEISQSLRKNHLKAAGVSVSVRDNCMKTKTWQCQLSAPIQSATILAKHARMLFETRYRGGKPIRLVTVTSIHLLPVDTPKQISLLDIENQKHEKLEAVDSVVESLREQYGEDAVKLAVLLQHKRPNKKKK